MSDRARYADTRATVFDVRCSPLDIAGEMHARQPRPRGWSPARTRAMSVNEFASNIPLGERGRVRGRAACQTT